MNDPYVYPHTDILRNFANIRDENELSCMEAEYTSIRLAELVTKDSVSRFDFAALCDMHYYIFQDIYEWAGQVRIINIEKAEPEKKFKISCRALEGSSVSGRQHAHDSYIWKPVY